MPRRKTYKKKRKKRMQMTLPLSGFPSSKMVRLRYATTFTLNPGAGQAQQQFRANSVFDPDYTGVGHQPMNFDNWASVYDRYVVVRSKITVHRVPNSQAAIVPMCYGITQTSDVAGISGLASLDDLLEQKSASRWRSPNYTSNSAGSGTNKVQKTFNARRFFGVSDIKDGQAYGALVTANPSHDAYFNVWGSAIGGNTATAAHFIATIDYTVLFRDPISQAGS